MDSYGKDIIRDQYIAIETYSIGCNLSASNVPTKYPLAERNTRPITYEPGRVICRLSS
jgi:hypothetical protein